LKAERADLAPAKGACAECLRRSWLLGELSPLLDYHRGDPARLTELLELDDNALIDATAGSRRGALKQALNGPPTDQGVGVDGARTICSHHPDWPAGLPASDSSMLWLSSSSIVFSRLVRSPRVAILGGRNASPYGIEMAAGLSRGLAAAGVTVVAGLGGELARAAHGGALELQTGTLAVASDGLRRIRPAAAARTGKAVARRGCLVSRLMPDASGRGWGLPAAEATVAALGDVAILIESDGPDAAFSSARAALSSGRPLGCIPGPITSHLSAGPHTLILEGAQLIRDARDVLELLYASRHEVVPDVGATGPPATGFDLRILERVGAGEDTAERLLRGPAGTGSVLAALGRLELAGALRRLPDGRYQARAPARRPV